MFSISEKTTKKLEELNKSFLQDFQITSHTAEQIIELIIKYNTEEAFCIELRNELISRGKDDISGRINIKKSVKTAVKHLEEQVKTVETINKNQKEISNSRGKLLSSISLLDKIQLEWMKHDLKATSL